MVFFLRQFKDFKGYSRRRMDGHDQHSIFASMEMSQCTSLICTKNILIIKSFKRKRFIETTERSH